MSEIFTCSRCREEHPITARTFFEGETLCPDCLEGTRFGRIICVSIILQKTAIA